MALELRGKDQTKVLDEGRTFRAAAKQFEREYEVITDGAAQSSLHDAQEGNPTAALAPVRGGGVLAQSTPKDVQKYRILYVENPPVDHGRSQKMQSRRRKARCTKRSLLSGRRPRRPTDTLAQTRS